LSLISSLSVSILSWNSLSSTPIPQRFSCSKFGHFQLVNLHLLMTLLARNTETIITVLNAWAFST
jgi:hypothetical protein